MLHVRVKKGLEKFVNKVFIHCEQQNSVRSSSCGNALCGIGGVSCLTCFI